MGQRRNQRLLSSAERTRFINAVKQMKTSGTYNTYVTLHSTVAASTDPDANPAHRGSAFLPWHRYLLCKFERDLQAADTALGGDGTITLPYWDWTIDNETDPTRARGRLWANDFLGGRGNPVASGPLAAAPWALVRANGDPTGFPATASVATDLPTPRQIREVLELRGYDCPPFAMASTPGPSAVRPNAPGVSGQSGGTLAPGTYRVAVTHVVEVALPVGTTTGETRPSQETVVCIGSGCSPGNSHNALRVAAPPAPTAVASGHPAPVAVGYRVYVTAPNGATQTGTLQGGLNAMGTATVINSIAVGAPRPSVNSTGSFRNGLEGWMPPPSGGRAHNGVHMWVNGSMTPPTSPNDPVFFLHHCNIDRLWAIWQQRNPRQNYPLVVPRVGGPGNRPQGLNDAMPPWTTAPELVRPIDVLNHTSITVNAVALGYTYDTDQLAINVAP